jgi:hypothetical protein
VRYFSFFAYQFKPGVPPPAAFGGRGVGRADILARFYSKQREAQAAPPVVKLGEDKPVHVGRGYALLNLKSESL